MKRLIIITLLFGIASLSAQPKQSKKSRPAFTPDQITELRTKQMVLNLELTNDQLQKIKPLLREQSVKQQKKRATAKALQKDGKKPSIEQIYKMRLERLDTQIAFQDDIKKVLNEKQFETWKKGKVYRMQKRKQRKGMNHKRKPVNGGRKG